MRWHSVGMPQLGHLGKVRGSSRRLGKA